MKRIKSIQLYQAVSVLSKKIVASNFDEESTVLPVRMGLDNGVVDVSYRDKDHSKSFDMGITLANIKSIVYHMGELDELHIDPIVEQKPKTKK